MVKANYESTPFRKKLYMQNKYNIKQGYFLFIFAFEDKKVKIFQNERRTTHTLQLLKTDAFFF